MSKTDEVRILIVDDHPLMRRGLGMVVEDEPDLEVIGEAGNGREALAACLELNPDVVIMDLLMPVMDGIDAIRAIQEQAPGTRILALSSATEDSKILEAVQAGALGYITKDAPPTDILRAARSVAHGEPFMPGELMFKLIHNLTPAASGSPGELWTGAEASQPLSSREQEIFDLVAEGLSNKAIAYRLHLSESTVRSHVYHMLNKLGLQDRNQIIVHALRKRPPESDEGHPVGARC